MGSTYKPTDSAWDYISQTATCHQVSPVGSLQTREKKINVYCSIREHLNKYHWKNRNATGYLEDYSWLLSIDNHLPFTHKSK